MRNMISKQDYLDSLPAWDGRKRIDTMLMDYLGSNDSTYVREVSRNMLLSAVACAYGWTKVSPIMPLLVSPAPCGKSVFLKKLGSGYSEKVYGEINDSKTNRLTDNLLVELTEKNVAITDIGYWSTPFLLVVTMNTMPAMEESQQIKPVHVGMNDLGRAYITEQDEINQLWAEAVNAFKNGEMPYAGTNDVDGRTEEEKPIIKLYAYGID